MSDLDRAKEVFLLYKKAFINFSKIMNPKILHLVMEGVDVELKHTRKMYEALHPERESFDALMQIRKNIGGAAFSSQYLQLQLKVKYGAVHIPKKYDSWEEWEEAEPEAVFRETFLRDHGLVILPEGCSAEEWEAKYGEKAKGTYRPT